MNESSKFQYKQYLDIRVQDRDGYFLRFKTESLQVEDLEYFEEKLGRFAVISCCIMVTLIYYTSYSRNSEIKRYMNSFSAHFRRFGRSRVYQRIPDQGARSSYVMHVSIVSHFCVMMANLKNFIEHCMISCAFFHPFFLISLVLQYIILFQQFRFLCIQLKIQSLNRYNGDEQAQINWIFKL